MSFFWHLKKFNNLTILKWVLGESYILQSALLMSSEIFFHQATKVYTEQLLELHRGQGMEIYWRDNFTCPTESEYKLMTIRKTGGLFMLAIRLMKLFSDSDKNFSQLTAILGLYFQIRDDYCNLKSEEAWPTVSIPKLNLKWELE